MYQLRQQSIPVRPGCLFCNFIPVVRDGHVVASVFAAKPNFFILIYGGISEIKCEKEVQGINNLFEGRSRSHSVQFLPKLQRNATHFLLHIALLPAKFHSHLLSS